MPSDQIDSAVAEKIDSFHGLLTRDVALKLIAKEKGLMKQEEKFVKIKEIEKGAKNISLDAKVERITPEAVYASGKRSRSVLLKDETGEIYLKLWEEGIALCSKLRIGSTVRVRNVYEKFGDINLGYKGTVEHVSGHQFTPLDSLAGADGSGQVRVHVYATISKVSGISGGQFSFAITDSKNEIDALIAESPERGNKMEEGDLVIIDNGKVENGKLVLDSNSRLLLKKQKGMVSGKVEKLESDGNTLSLIVGGKPLVFDRTNAEKFLSVSIPENISLQTVVELKRDSILNSNVNLRVKEEGGTFLIAG